MSVMLSIQLMASEGFRGAFDGQKMERNLEIMYR